MTLYEDRAKSSIGPDLEIEISYDLAQRVLQHEEVLVAVSDLCGELDSMFALALGAHQYKLVRPRMTEANIIDIKSCRHLLQEMTVASYVTNNAYLVGGNDNNPPPIPSTPATPSSSSEPTSPSMLLLTGPNYSGKSVYLKSVAQTLYLSHLGSFVPCSSATIGLTDALLTRIRTCETVSRPHSAFMIDLQQVAYILKMATSRSLVVIDEFGKGTDAADGAGLAAGVFGHLLGEGRGVRPKVLAATHFHEIFEMGYLDPRRGLGLMLAHMEVRVDCRNNHVSTGSTEDDISTTTTTDGGTATEVTYLYNLRPGRSSESFGTQCAAMNGVPGPVVERARQLTLLAAKGEDLVRVCTGVGSREEEEDLVRAEGVARRFLMWDLDGDGDGGELRRVLREVLGEEDEEGEDREGDDEMVTETESVLRTGPGSGS